MDGHVRLNDARNATSGGVEEIAVADSDKRERTSGREAKKCAPKSARLRA